VFGKENAWIVASTTETISDSLKAEIKKDFEAKGFKPDNVAVPGKSHIIYKTLAATPGESC